MNRNTIISRIMEVASYYDIEDFEEYTDDELEDLLGELTNNSDMHPNDRDFDAEDEEF